MEYIIIFLMYLQIMSLDDSKVKLEQVNDSLSTQVQYKEDLNTVRDNNNNNNNNNGKSDDDDKYNNNNNGDSDNNDDD